MQVLKNLFGKNAKIHVDEIATKVDGVKQLLGFAIISGWGSNGEGSWIKFGNGFMICWNKTELKNLNVLPNSHHFASFKFPQQFISTPVCFYSGYPTDSQGNRRGVPLVEDRPTLASHLKGVSWAFHFVNPAGATNIISVLDISMIAIGRWK